MVPNPARESYYQLTKALISLGRSRGYVLVDELNSFLPGSASAPSDLEAIYTMFAKLAIGAGATFVARGTAFHANQIDKLIVEAIQHKGFSVVEILDDCPTTYGRRNKYKSVIEMMNRLKEVAVPVKAAEKMTAEQLEGKVLTGVLYKEVRPHYTDEYAKVITRAQAVSSATSWGR